MRFGYDPESHALQQRPGARVGTLLPILARFGKSIFDRVANLLRFWTSPPRCQFSNGDPGIEGMRQKLRKVD